MKKFLHWTEARLEILWRRAEASTEVDDQSLAVLRVLYGLFVVIVMMPSVSWIAGVPQSLFLPPVLSPAMLFDGFPAAPWYLLIDVSMVVLTLCILFGVRARLAGILFSAVYLASGVFAYSFGKIDHAIMFPVFTLALSLTNWGVGYALVPDKRVSQQAQKTVLAVLAVVLCFAFFSAGAEKALNWVDLDLGTSGFLSWYYPGYFGLERDYLLAPLVLWVPPQLFEVLDYTAVVFELSPLVALLAGRKWWLLWLFIASVFHLSNLLLLNIPFAFHAVVYLCFVPLGSPVAEMIRRPFSKLRRIPVALVATLFIAIHCLFQFTAHGVFNPLSDYALPLAGSKVELDLYIGLVVWVPTVYWVGIAAIKSFANRESLQRPTARRRPEPARTPSTP